jgi:hypothetical protein
MHNQSLNPTANCEGITHVYYKKSSKDQNVVFNKLSEEVRDAILNDNREKLSVLELNELIREKTINEEVGEAIPYMVCPKCGSEDLERTSDVEVDYGPDCCWSIFYRFTGA